MLSIRRSDVPRSLHESVFYLSLSADDDDEIIIPEKYLTLDLTVDNEESLRNLLSTLRFWGVNSVPEELCRISIDVNNDFFEMIVPDFISELSYLSLLVEVRHCVPELRIAKAAGAGNLDLLKYLVRTQHSLSTISCELAARFGHLLCLQYLNSVGCPWDTSTCRQAARHGHLECLKFAYEQGCPWHTNAIAEDAARGGIDCLRFVCERDASLHSSIYNIFAVNNDLHSLTYVHKHGVPWSLQFVENSVYHDSLECLQYALDNGCAFVDDALCNVKSVDCIKLIHNSGYVWSVYSSAMIAKTGNVSILQYVHELGCPWDENTCINAVKNRHNIDCFVYAIEKGCTYTIRTVLMAVKCKHTTALLYLHTQMFVFTSEVSAKAVDFHGPGLEMLVFLRSLECPWDEQTTHKAAIYSRLDCLMYAMEHGCAVSSDICYEVGMRGEYEILKYLHTQGCVLISLQLNKRNEKCVQYVKMHKIGSTTCGIQ